MIRYKIAVICLIKSLSCLALTQSKVVTARNVLHATSSSDTKRLAAIAASISEHDNQSNVQQALSSSVRYLESLSKSASDMISDNLSDADDEFTYSIGKKELPIPRVLLDLQSQRRSYRFDVSLPTSTIGVASSTCIGLAIRRISADGSLSNSALDIDTLSFISLEDETFRTMKTREMCLDKDVSEENAIQILSDSQWKNNYTVGLIVSSVVRRGLAWEAGVRAGDYLVATSATIGDVSFQSQMLSQSRFLLLTDTEICCQKMWPKSTLDGVRSAVSSRKLLSSSVQLTFERPAQFSDGSVVEEFELSLTRPIGITIESMYFLFFFNITKVKYISNNNLIQF
jgi:hypothetical protein